MKRRKFIKKSGLSVGGMLTFAQVKANTGILSTDHQTIKSAVCIATWNVENATRAAWSVLKEDGSALDAVETGAKIEEADVNNQTVGKGGRPDREGNVTLDASIMDHQGNCGSVVCMQNITHAISVARKVMEETPHVMLAGKGAEQFALEQGFQAEDLLTSKSAEDYQKWLETSNYEPVINIENHDTIGILALDAQGNLAGGCTTSGMAYKMAGRVGDSPIIGAGLFVDQKVGAATATGMGEEVVKTVGSFLVVELMRQGHSPDEACQMAVERIVENNPECQKIQIGYIALDKYGNSGAYCIHPGFNYRRYDNKGHQLITPGSHL